MKAEKGARMRTRTKGRKEEHEWKGEKDKEED